VGLTVNVLVGHPALVADRSWAEDIALPALLRAARRTYATAIRASLADVGCADLPRNGPYVVGAIARTGAPLHAIIAELGVSKQAAGQLVDTLVERGYLDRSVDAADRRRIVVSLTARGRTAARASRAAVDQVDAALAARVGAASAAQCRRVLAALIELGSQAAPP